MRGTFRENFKNALIAILIGIVAMQSITWRDTICRICGGYLFAEATWFVLITYDEILRKRRASRRRNKRRADA